MSEMKKFDVFGTGLDRTDYLHDAPSQEEFFRKVAMREQALSALEANKANLNPSYRQRLQELIDNVTPFEDYMTYVWRNVQKAGFGTAEKHRLMNIFGTDDNFKIAYGIAKKKWTEYETATVVDAYAVDNTNLGPNLQAQLGAVGPSQVTKFGGMSSFVLGIITGGNPSTATPITTR